MLETTEIRVENETQIAYLSLGVGDGHALLADFGLSRDFSARAQRSTVSVENSTFGV